MDTTTATDAATDPATDAPQPPEGVSFDAAVEAILLTTERPLAPAKVAEALAPWLGEADNGPKQVAEAVERLNSDYARAGRAFRIEQVAGGYRAMTVPELAPALAGFHRARMAAKLSRAAIETLAIVAYRQPITRAQLEAIRGVGCGEVLRTLMERRLVTITGRAEELGRPMLYGTTRTFLDTFGLSNLKDLPDVGQGRSA
ncbi:MAG: SMC-Scp complex subunit ScpB [Phycisphaerales bacterium JB039]